MLTAFVASATVILGFACVVAGFTVQHHRQRAEEHIPASWHDDGQPDPVDWLRDYPGRPAPTLDRMQYRPRHGALIGVDAYWEAPRAYRIVTGRRRVAWSRILTPMRVEFSRFRRPPSRLGRWKVVGGVR